MNTVDYNKIQNRLKGALFGLAVGDALGVPYEFKLREILLSSPATDMIGYGSWNQPPGTWSDDSSLAFCLAQSLTAGYDLQNIASNFIKWMTKGYWGAHYEVFDIGGTTRRAIIRLSKGVSPPLAGGMMEEDNGNGSLMRILPLLFYIAGKEREERYSITKAVSSLTHAHFRSVLSCFIYLEIARGLLNGLSKTQAYELMQTTVSAFVSEKGFAESELLLFSRVLKNNISEESTSSIHSSGYVLHTLEAALWCFLKTDNYKDAVIMAVNLGGDTDTTACVCGGLAGLHYGYDMLPDSWLQQLARRDDIETLCKGLFKSMYPKQ